MADLHALERSGMAGLVVALAGRGTPVLGICGGYQMLGERILDPSQAESDDRTSMGLGLLPTVTTFAA